MEVFEFIDLDNLNDLGLKQLEHLANQLQVRFKPPILERDRNSIIHCIKFIANNYSKIGKYEIIDMRKKSNPKRCFNEITELGQETALLSDNQMIFRKRNKKIICQEKDDQKIQLDRILKKVIIGIECNVCLEMTTKNNPLIKCPYYCEPTHLAKKDEFRCCTFSSCRNCWIESLKIQISDFFECPNKTCDPLEKNSRPLSFSWIYDNFRGKLYDVLYDTHIKNIVAGQEALFMNDQDQVKRFKAGYDILEIQRKIYKIIYNMKYHYNKSNCLNYNFVTDYNLPGYFDIQSSMFISETPMSSQTLAIQDFINLHKNRIIILLKTKFTKQLYSYVIGGKKGKSPFTFLKGINEKRVLKFIEMRDMQDFYYFYSPPYDYEKNIDHDKLSQLVAKMVSNIEQYKKDYPKNSQNSIERKDRILFKCYTENCKGFVKDMVNPNGSVNTLGDLSRMYICPICDVQYCDKCGEPISYDSKKLDSIGKLHSTKSDSCHKHTCNKDTIETFKLVMETTKPCPQCKTAITYISGCDQMFCTQCHTVFSWKTLDIYHGSVVHNPHYIDAVKKGIIKERDRKMLQGIVCGGIPTIEEVLVIGRKIDKGIPSTNHDKLYEIWRIAGERATDLEYFENNTNRENTDLMFSRLVYLSSSNKKKFVKNVQKHYLTKLGLQIHRDIYSVLLDLLARGFTYIKDAPKDELLGILEEMERLIMQMDRYYIEEILASKSYRFMVEPGHENILE